MLKITPHEIKVISQYIYDISGIVLDHSKAYLIETRLGSLIKKEGCSSYSEFYQRAKADVSKIS